MKPAVKRLSRAEQQQRTRDALLDAAIELIVDQGIDATSIEEIAEHAGFSRGAFYSNFDSKNDLVIAASARFFELVHAAALPDGHAPSDVGDAFRERLIRARQVVSGGASVFLAEISLYVIRHPELQDAFAAMHSAQLVPAIAFARDRLADAGLSKPSNVSYEMLATIVQALTFALDLLGRSVPTVDSEKAMTIATRALFRGLS